MLENSQVLIVGDDPNQTELIAKLLRVHGVNHVCTASPLQELWKHLEEDKYNLLLLDYSLPVEKGENALVEYTWRGRSLLMNTARLATIGELASGVAHLVNNPLTTIIAEAQILLQNLPETHRGRDSAEAIEEAGWRVQKAVQQLLDFSKPPTTTRVPVDLNKTISNAIRLVEDKISASGVKLQVEMAEGLPPVRGDPRQLVDLWINLLMLAHLATSDGREHSITVRSALTPSRGVRVEVCDDGRPITTDEIDVLFAPNLSAIDRNHRMGIEMTLCQEIVRQHQGQISAENHPGGVTILRVTLPAEASL